SAPPLFKVRRSPRDPGTRSMSPKEQKITSGREAMAWALSIISSEVTQTGQPGPCTSSTCSGMRRSIPCFTMLWVCPPHTSISAHGFVTVRWIWSRRVRATRPSRYSSRNFMASALRLLRRLELRELSHLLEQLVGPRRLFRVDHAQGEAHVDEDVVADLGR